MAFYADCKGTILGPYASYDEANQVCNEAWDDGYGGEPWEFGVVEAPDATAAKAEATRQVMEADVEAHTLHAHL